MTRAVLLSIRPALGGDQFEELRLLLANRHLLDGDDASASLEQKDDTTVFGYDDAQIYTEDLGAVLGFLILQGYVNLSR